MSLNKLECVVIAGTQKPKNTKGTPTGVIVWVPRLFFFRGHYLKMQTYSSHKIVSTLSFTLYLSLELESGSKLSFLPSNGPSARRYVVTYRLDVVFGSLHTQQLHGFDELRNDQGII
jgi:hypothetical protein